jgi:hypothetical protein
MKMLLRGAPRSGTHLATQWLVEKHFPSVNLDTAHRHRLIDFADFDPKIRILACTKHPLAWLVSMHRFVLQSAVEGRCVVDGVRYRAEVNFARFVAMNPILFEFWNVSNLNWLVLGATFVDYDLVINDPETAVERFAEDLDLPIPIRAEPLPEFTLHGGKPMDFDYYREERWRETYDLETWWASRDSLDPRLTRDYDLTWRTP